MMRRRLTAMFAGAILLASCASPTPSPTPPPPTTSPATSVPSSSPSAGPSAPVNPALSPPASPAVPAAVGNWVRLDDMSLARWSFAALELLDGRVFVIDQEACNGMSDLTGPPRPPGPTDLLDPATGHWTPADALNATRSGFVALRLRDGRVLVTGGDNGWHASYSSTKLFDPTTGRWTATGLLNTARMDPVGALLPDGRVLVAGGTYSEGFRGEEDFFNRTDSPDTRDLTSAEIYDPETGRWTLTGSLNEASSAGDAYALPDGRVLAVGHAWSSEQRDAEIYDPVRGTWSVAGNLVRLPGSASVVLPDGSLLVIGGTTEVVAPDGNASDIPVATVRRFNPDAGTTDEIAPLPAPRTGSVAVGLADGRVLVAGGTEVERLESGLEAPPTATAFLYDPARDAWVATAPMPFAVEPGQGVLLSDGSVLVAGGTVLYEQAVTDACLSSAFVALAACFISVVAL